MHQVTLKAEKRDRAGKEACKKIRREGKVPGIVYGKDMENVMVQVDAKELRKTLSTHAGTRVIVNLEVQNGKSKEVYTTMIAEIQKDIFQKQYYHVDFHKISLEEKVHTEVPVILVGEAKGVKAGGVLDHLLWSVPVKGLPLDIPEAIEVDITDMKENDHLLVKDLPVNGNLEILEDPEEVVAVIHPPKVVATEGEGEETSETVEETSTEQ